ncbi:MAG: hypothetical protein K9G26_10430 [Emcibacter sp.]|nr:hypothetical protein [Emcibacter sp.]
MTYTNNMKRLGMSMIIVMTASFPAAAFSQNSASEKMEIASISMASNISKNDARKIVNEYLKTNKKRSQRIGKIESSDTGWAVQILTRENFPIAVARVDKETGALSFE